MTVGGQGLRGAGQRANHHQQRGFRQVKVRDQPVDDAKAVQSRIADHFAPQNPEIEGVDGLGMAFDDWRFNVRASNTEPLLRLNVEARGDADLVSARVEEITKLIQTT